MTPSAVVGAAGARRSDVTYAVALALTVSIEVPLYLALAAFQGRRIESTDVRAAVVVNLVSHPLLWFALYPLGSFAVGEAAGLLLAESVVVVGEAAGIRWLVGEDWADVLPRATVANGASLLAGLWLDAVFL